MRRYLAAWYMGRIAGRYCPCEWPLRIKSLIRLCGRVDDYADREHFRRAVRFYMARPSSTTSSTATSKDVEWQWMDEVR